MDGSVYLTAHLRLSLYIRQLHHTTVNNYLLACVAVFFSITCRPTSLSREFTPCSKLSKWDLDIIWIRPHLELDRTTPNPRTLSTKTEINLSIMHSTTLLTIATIYATTGFLFNAFVRKMLRFKF